MRPHNLMAERDDDEYRNDGPILGATLTTLSGFGLIAAPLRPSVRGRLPKWPTGADCKSAGSRLRWFESITYHHFFTGLPVSHHVTWASLGAWHSRCSYLLTS